PQGLAERVDTSLRLTLSHQHHAEADPELGIGRLGLERLLQKPARLRRSAALSRARRRPNEAALALQNSITPEPRHAPVPPRDSLAPLSLIDGKPGQVVG